MYGDMVAPNTVQGAILLSPTACRKINTFIGIELVLNIGIICATFKEKHYLWHKVKYSRAQNQESIDRQKIGTRIIRKVVLQEIPHLFPGKKPVGRLLK